MTLAVVKDRKEISSHQFHVPVSQKRRTIAGSLIAIPRRKMVMLALGRCGYTCGCKNRSKRHRILELTLVAAVAGAQHRNISNRVLVALVSVIRG